MNPKPQKNLAYLIILAVAAVIILGAFYLLVGKKEPASTSTSTTTPAAIFTPTPEFIDESGLEAEPSEEATQPADETKDWKVYEDKKVGFSFKYPPEVTLFDLEKGSQKDIKGLALSVTTTDLNTKKALPLGYDTETAKKDKTALQKGDPSVRIGTALSQSRKILNLPNVIAKVQTTLIPGPENSVGFKREAIIYFKNFQIIITLNYFGEEIQNNNPSYFTRAENCTGNCIEWKQMGDKFYDEKFYDDLLAGKTDSVSQNWYKTFDKIITTFQVAK